jgi:hypothetical protein
MNNGGLKGGKQRKADSRLGRKICASCTDPKSETQKLLSSRDMTRISNISSSNQTPKTRPRTSWQAGLNRSSKLL